MRLERGQSEFPKKAHRCWREFGRSGSKIVISSSSIQRDAEVATTYQGYGGCVRRCVVGSVGKAGRQQ
jgi:hypothetical protein